jgi:hypothetical protein
VRLCPPAIMMQIALLLAPSLASAQTPSPTPPPAIMPDAYHAEHVTHRIVPGLPEQVRDWLEGKQIIAFFPKTDKLPAIAKVEVLTPKWFETGSRRHVTFVDGNTVDERVMVYDSRIFQYQIWGFTNLSRFTIDYIVGAFEYRAETPETTRVTWTYRIKPLWGLLTWPVDSFLKGTFVPIMEGAMTNMAAARLEEAGRP